MDKNTSFFTFSVNVLLRFSFLSLISYKIFFAPNWILRITGFYIIFFSKGKKKINEFEILKNFLNRVEFNSNRNWEKQFWRIKKNIWLENAWFFINRIFTILTVFDKSTIFLGLVGNLKLRKKQIKSLFLKIILQLSSPLLNQLSKYNNGSGQKRWTVQSPAI